jgi:hypothetical protein
MRTAILSIACVVGLALTSGSAKAGGFDVVVKFGPSYGYGYYPLVKPLYVTPSIYSPTYYPYYPSLYTPSLYVPKPVVVTPVYPFGGYGFSKYPTFPHHHHHKHKK